MLTEHPDLAALVGAQPHRRHRHPAPAQPCAAASHPGPGAGPRHRGHASRRAPCDGSARASRTPSPRAPPRPRRRSAASASSSRSGARTGSDSATARTCAGSSARPRGSSRARGLFGSMMTLLGFGALALILWYTGHQVIDGTLTLGALTGLPALRHRHRHEPELDRQHLRAVPGGRRRGRPCLRGHRRAAHHPRPADAVVPARRDRGPDHLRGTSASATTPSVPVAPRHRPRDRPGRGPRGRGALGRRQDDALQPHPAALGRHRRTSPRRRA